MKTFIAALLAIFSAVLIADAVFISGSSPALVAGATQGGCASDVGYIGQTVQDASNARVNNVFYYTTFSVTTEGLAQYGHVYTATAGGGGLTFGIYNMEGTLLSQANIASPSNTTGVWQHFGAGTAYCLSTSTTYILGVVSADGTWSIYRDTTDLGKDRLSVPMNYGATLPSTHSFLSPTVLASGTSHSISFNNTSATE